MCIKYNSYVEKEKKLEVRNEFVLRKIWKKRFEKSIFNSFNRVFDYRVIEY